MRKEQHVREMWERFCQDRARVKRFQEQAEEERQAGIQGQWQLESPAREYLEQVKCCSDTDCMHRMMKQIFVALKSGECEIFFSKNQKVKVSEWAFDKVKEAFEQVAKDEAKTLLTIVQEIMIRSTDYLRRIIVPAGEDGCVTMSYCHSFPLEDYVWWVSG